MNNIPWNIIGPAASIVVIILGIVFGFILKFKKLDKQNSGIPNNSNTLSKKSLCFKHEAGIASNKTAVEMACKSIDKYQEQNRADHKTIFTKMDDMTKTILTQKTEILEAIKKNNS